MSYYLSTLDLEKTLKNKGLEHSIIHPGDEDVVASWGNKKLLFKDYTEDKLKQIVQEEKNAMVHNHFWNFYYCDEKNIEDKSIKGDNTLIDLNTYMKGKLILTVSMIDIISGVFKVKDCSKYLKCLNIDKCIFADFLINFKHTIPLTDCFLELIVRIFEPDNILDFLFDNKPRFNIGETETILNEIEIFSLNRSAIYIFSMKISECEKLKYFNILLNVYQNEIDITTTVYTSMNQKDKYAGYYLLNMDLEEDLINLYLDTIKLFMDKNGSVDFIITDNHQLNDKLKKRKDTIKCIDVL